MVLVGATASAQSLEAGGSVAVSCKGSDGSFCNDSQSNLATLGPYASVWLGDRLELGGRIVWLRQRVVEGVLRREDGSSFRVDRRRRSLVQGEAVWHFRRGKRVRPTFGLGVGRYLDRERITCSPPGCESRLPFIGLAAGRRDASHSDISLAAGLSMALPGGLRIRGGWRYHNPFKDELALSELFVSLGYRFGTR